MKFKDSNIWVLSVSSKVVYVHATGTFAEKSNFSSVPQKCCLNSSNPTHPLIFSSQIQVTDVCGLSDKYFLWL